MIKQVLVLAACAYAKASNKDVANTKITANKVIIQIQACRQIILSNKQIKEDCNLCSGVLISDKHVLTTAHCLSGSTFAKIINDPMAPITQTKHKVKLNDLADYITVASDAYVIHPDYNEQTLAKNLAVIFTGKKITANPLKYSLIKNTPSVNDTMSMSEWKFHTMKSSTTSSSLIFQTQLVKIIQKSYCLEIMSEVDNESEYCVKLPNAISCDTSSSVLFTNENEKLVLAGILSFPSGSCERSLYNPGVFTNLYMHRDWIASTLYSINFNGRKDNVMRTEDFTISVDILKEEVDALKLLDSRYEVKDSISQLGSVHSSDNPNLFGTFLGIESDGFYEILHHHIDKEQVKKAEHMLKRVFGPHWKIGFILVNLCFVVILIFSIYKIVRVIKSYETSEHLIKQSSSESSENNFVILPHVTPQYDILYETVLDFQIPKNVCKYPVDLKKGDSNIESQASSINFYNF